MLYFPLVSRACAGEKIIADYIAPHLALSPLSLLNKLLSNKN